MKALEESEIVHPKVKKSSMMVIACPNVCHFPDVLSSTENVDVSHLQVLI